MYSIQVEADSFVVSGWGNGGSLKVEHKTEGEGCAWERTWAWGS